MTAVRGPYNKSSQHIPLDDDQLETLAKGFTEHRKTVPGPHCKTPTIFRTKVTSSQPQQPSPFPPQFEIGATLDMQTLFQMLMTLITELQQARTEIANLKE
ncbi:hypothetical protein G6F56_012715 [Rhizopus delemar]|nr:hypothetical protein G6F56_012715 [Rhizopus delemar]